MKIDGVKLQNEIARRQMTITDFAKQAGLPMSTVYRAIGGGRSSTRTAGRIAAALQITPSEISYVIPAQMKGGI